LRTCHQLRGPTARCDIVAYSGEPIITKPAPETEHRPAPEVPKKPLALAPAVKSLPPLPPQ
jgi:hypothetical protein